MNCAWLMVDWRAGDADDSVKFGLAYEDMDGKNVKMVLQIVFESESLA
jgi:hypothetical protein